DLARDAVHGEVANDLSGIRAGLLHPAALESDLGIFLDVEKRLAQMFVAFRDAGIDARRLHPDYDRRLLRMIAIDDNRPADFRDLPLRCADAMPVFEGERRTRGIEL